MSNLPPITYPVIDRRGVRQLFVTLVILALSLGIAACGDDDDKATPIPSASPTPTQPASSTPTRRDGDIGPDDPAHPASTRAGVAAVDAVIDAVLSQDFAKLRPQLVALKLKCATQPAGGIPQPPKCPAGVSDGTVVDAFPVGGPEGSYLLLSEADRAFTALLGSRPRLFAVYRVAQTSSDAIWPGGKYGVVFVGTGQVRGVDVRVSDDGVVNVNYGGGPTNPSTFTDRVAPADFIVRPAK